MTMTINGSSGLIFPDGSGQETAIGRNRIINGDMRIDQRNAGALVAGAAGEIYGVDRFVTGVFGSGTGRISAQQSSTAPTGFVKSLINTVTTADAAPSANFGYCVTQRIEGFNTADLMWGTASPQTVTVSFWVRNSIAGTYCITLANEAVTWAYTTTYTVSSANTWEQKTVTFTGPTSGTWLTTNGAGIVLVFGLGGGSNRQATLNAWYAPTSTNTPTDASGCVDWIATNGATFYITGVQLEVGSTATPFERRLYNQELANCQRYYYRNWYNTGNTARLSLVAAFNATRTFGGMSVPVPMRATPTLSYGSNTYFQLETLNLATTYAITNFNIFSTANTTSNNLYSIEINVASGLTAGNVYHVSLVVTSGSTTLGYYDFSSEL